LDATASTARTPAAGQRVVTGILGMKNLDIAEIERASG
jgi:hypothetical protein